MDRTTSSVVGPLPLAVLVTVVNEWGDVPRRAAGEDADPYPSPAALRADEPGLWRGVPDTDETVLVEVANLLHPVFAAASDVECAEHLDRLVRDSGLVPAVTSDGGEVRQVWCVPAGRRELLAAAVLAVLEQLRRDPEVGRLGTCAGEDCADVFVDQSPAGRRHFCSLTCQNRARARAYRAHRRAAARP